MKGDAPFLAIIFLRVGHPRLSFPSRLHHPLFLRFVHVLVLIAAVITPSSHSPTSIFSHFLLRLSTPPLSILSFFHFFHFRHIFLLLLLLVLLLILLPFLVVAVLHFSLLPSFLSFLSLPSSYSRPCRFTFNDHPHFPFLSSLPHILHLPFPLLRII